MQPASLAGRGVAQRHAARQRRNQKVGIGGRSLLLAGDKALCQRKRADLALNGLESRRQPLYARVPECLSTPDDVSHRLARRVPVGELPRKLGLAAAHHGNRHARALREARHHVVYQLLRAAGVERELAAEPGGAVLGGLGPGRGLNRHVGRAAAAVGHAHGNARAGHRQRGPAGNERPSGQLDLGEPGQPRRLGQAHARSPSSSARIWAMTCCAPCSRLLGMTRCAICLTP